MLLRLIVENFASFKEAVEFNTFPASKTQNHENHKIECGHATVLRMSAIYGANGAGKSNILNALSTLKTLVERESLRNLTFHERPTFRFEKTCSTQPSGIAVEFFYKGTVYYYHIEFDPETIHVEELFISKRSKDIKVFSREEGNISMNKELFAKGYNEQLVEALTRLVRPDMLFLSFMGRYYADEIPQINEAYKWFTTKLRIVMPSALTGMVPHLLDINPNFASLVNAIIPELKTGILKLSVKKEAIIEDEIKNNPYLVQQVKLAKQYPGIPQILISRVTNEVANVIYEDNMLYIKTLVSIHKNIQGETFEMSVANESDGTKRLIEYMPLFYDITQQDDVYVIDEIERSIHPILIKEIIHKLSLGNNTKGQLIFTTHESGLLDQTIFRPDEIWFAQKDTEQATQLYPLSDYNIHKTANIENGYLSGRYGGIPFLSNLNDLHW